MYIRDLCKWAHLKSEFVHSRCYPPKAKAGLRAISIPAKPAAVLKRWKLQSPPSEIDLVFPQ
jgi:hypothetical protein